MTVLSWTTCLTLSAAGVATVSLLSGLISDSVKQSASLSSLFVFLITYGSIAALAIVVVGVVFKGLAFLAGQGLILISRSFPVPDIPLPIERAETQKLIKIIEKTLDKRTKVFKRVGVTVKKDAKNVQHQRSYDFYYKGHLAYYFSMQQIPNDNASVEFSDGYLHHFDGAIKGIGTITRSLNDGNFKVKWINLAIFIDQSGALPTTIDDMSYSESAERLWKKVGYMIGNNIQAIDKGQWKD